MASSKYKHDPPLVSFAKNMESDEFLAQVNQDLDYALEYNEIVLRLVIHGARNPSYDTILDDYGGIYDEDDARWYFHGTISPFTKSMIENDLEHARRKIIASRLTDYNDNYSSGQYATHPPTKLFRRGCSYDPCERDEEDAEWE